MLRWAALLMLGLPLGGQVCRLNVAGLNRNRAVLGPVNAECPGPLPHTAPFGNWGVTSNFGPKLNGHQFDGWCHDSRICDNNGECRTVCRDGWYEWNSCTDALQYRAPNCTLYNDAECTRQVTVTGVNVLGTQTVELRAACPVDTNGDGVADDGGCAGLTSYTHGTNYQSLYELDPFTGDQLIQTLYFPPTPVRLACTALSCAPGGSEWVTPSGFDSPAGRVLAWAEMAMVVNSGSFADPGGACRGVTRVVRPVNSASFVAGPLAADSIVSLYGVGLAERAAAPPAGPLPTALEGVSVTLTDSGGTARPASLAFVSPGQINAVLPAELRAGYATITVTRGGATVSTGVVEVVDASPGVFTASADGRGVPAALTVTVSAGGIQTVAPVFDCRGGPSRCEPVAVDVRGGETYLILFGTGIRRTGPSARVTAGGLAAEVVYAGPQPEYPGLDQVNVRLPRELAGRGDIAVRLTAGGRDANEVIIRVR